MNECEESQNFVKTNCKKNKKKRRIKNLLTKEENINSNENIDVQLLTKTCIVEVDDVFHMGGKGDNSNEQLLDKTLLNELLNTTTVDSFSNTPISLCTSNNDNCKLNESVLSSKTWQQDSCNNERDAVNRSRSVSRLLSTQTSLLSTSSSVPDLGVDNQSQSSHSSMTIASENRLYQPPMHRDFHSTFSLKIKSNDCSGNVAEIQLQTELTNELLKYFPEKMANIMIITWNMAAISTYPELFIDLISKNNSNEMSDLYLLCFQETTSNKQELLMRIQLSMGGHYVIYSYVENGSLFGVLVGHKKFIWNLALIGKGSISTRVTPITKGAVAISFQFFGKTILFLGSHLSSGESSSGDQGRNMLRIEDFKLILYSKELIKALTNPSMKLGTDETNLSHYFDYTFWAGDLNFRINRDDVTVARLILSELECNDGQAFEELLEYDELINSQAAGFAFQEFEEGRITFLPTYRFTIQTDMYTEKRTPSYTDRILFRSHQCRGAECVYYNSVPSYKYSDHKPVCAVIEIGLEPQKSEHLKAAGHFHKEIYNKCFEARETKQSKAASRAKSASTPQSPVCSIQ